MKLGKKKSRPRGEKESEKHQRIRNHDGVRGKKRMRKRVAACDLAALPQKKASSRGRLALPKMKHEKRSNNEERMKLCSIFPSKGRTGKCGSEERKKNDIQEMAALGGNRHGGRTSPP